MSSLLNLLNPEADYETRTRNEAEIGPHNATPSSSTSPSIIYNVDAVRYTRDEVTQPQVEHVMHADCPDTLNCLPDTDGRPQHTLPVILRCAILGSPRKRLTIREIYSAMEDKYSYYKTAGPTWKQSVRHHLSLNRLFERQPRPVTDPGFGSYWTVNLAAPPGTKRPRKRGRPNRDLQDDIEPPPAKRRGRPRKNPQQFPPIATLGVSSDRALRDGQVSSVRTTREPYEDAGDDRDISEEGEIEPSDEDYESEEDMDFTNNRATTSSGAALGSQSSFSKSVRPLVPASFPPMGSSDNGDNLIDRLHIEMEGLRRQSADAIAVSRRMSDQLSEVQMEAARARASLKAAEKTIEEEGRKRRAAERALDEETRRRRTAEEALRHFQIQSSSCLRAS